MLSTTGKKTDRDDRMARWEGGAIIGRGHDENIVYTMDELTVLYPGYVRVDMESWLQPEKNTSYTLKDIMTTRDGVRLQQTLALKHVSDGMEFTYEISLNKTVRRIFSKADMLHLTVLHDFFDTVKVHMMANEGVDEKHKKKKRWMMAAADPLLLSPPPYVRELMYRRMLGSVDRLHSFDEDALITVAKSCLMFLCALHASGYIHMDIKPENVLYDMEKGAVKCVLADYGLIAPMDEVIQRVKKYGNFFQGTAGFMSPLLTLDDSENRVYEVFASVMTERINKTLSSSYMDRNTDRDRGRSSSYWDAFFTQQKRRLSKPSDIAKVDLQSLALTLHSLTNYLKSRQKHDIMNASPKTKRRARMDVLEMMISRLLLHGTNDFFTARDALRELYRMLGVDVTSDRDAVKALRAADCPTAAAPLS